MQYSWAAASHPGVRRSGNEDSYAAKPSMGLFVVADGMGGHVAGEVASRLAVDTIEAFVVETAEAGRDRTWPVPFDPALSLDANRLRTAFRLANRRLGEEMAKRGELRGMATTASGVLLRTGHVPVIAHVGDSRVYRWRAGRLDRLTTDHSWVEEQVRAGIFDARTASLHPWRNVVTRALSGADDLQVDVFELPIEAGDRLLLCSDGLSSVVPEDRIAEVLGSEPSLDAACSRLVELANVAGGPDNITVIALEIHVA